MPDSAQLQLNTLEPVITQFDLQVDGLAPGLLQVARFEGVEGVSEPFRFDIDLASTDGVFDLEDLVGRNATFSWSGPGGTRRIAGTLCRFAHGGARFRRSLYRARLVPRLWTLGLRRDSRIFQGLSVPQIVGQVLEEHGLVGEEVRLRLGQTHRPLEYCTQHRESDLDFVSRLLEDEGILYYVDDDGERNALALTDASSSCLPISGDPDLIWRPGGPTASSREFVRRFRLVRRLVTTSALLRDFDFRRPSLRLEGRREEEASPNEWYDHPGGFVETGHGDERARIRLEELRAAEVVGHGRGCCTRFQPGRRFRLEEHASPECNREYLLLRVRHQGAQPEALGDDGHELAARPRYRNAFECVPSEVPWRPPRATPRPRIEGPQTAIVVGPRGEQIHTDVHGRVKVQFHWDRLGAQDEHSSCWIRVSQGWAGACWGALFLPRIGQEVVVSFLEGDPDCPLITGRVYNGENPPPQDLPARKARSTIRSSTTPGDDGFNELTFEDTAGAEEVFLHAQRDWNTTVRHDRSQGVGNDESMNVGNDRDRQVGRDERIQIGRDRELTVTGNEQETVGGNQTLEVGVNRRETVEGDSFETVGGSKSEEVRRDCNLTVRGNSEVLVGADLTETVVGDRTESVTGNKTETVSGHRNTRILGNEYLMVDGQLSALISEILSLTTNQDIEVNAMQDVILRILGALRVGANGAIRIESGGDIVLCAGSSRLVLKQDGTVRIEGNRVVVKATADVKIQGATVAIN